MKVNTKLMIDIIEEKDNFFGILKYKKQGDENYTDVYCAKRFTEKAALVDALERAVETLINEN